MSDSNFIFMEYFQSRIIFAKYFGIFKQQILNFTP